MHLLTESKAYKPFFYPWAMECAEKHERMHWGTWEAKLQEDVKQWKSNILSPVEKRFITQILRIFTQSDVAVGDNYVDFFLPVFKNNEVRNMLLSFANREGTHQRAYALLNDTLGLAEEEYGYFLSHQPMLQKIENMKCTDDLGQALVQSVCNEGMSLFSAFVMLLHFQKNGKMKGMCEVVEWSIKDESMHTEAMTKLYHTYISEGGAKPSIDDATTIFTRAVTFEDAVIDLIFDTETSVEDLSKAQVKEFIRYLANRRLEQLGYSSIYPIERNPLPWLDWIVSGVSFKNFFEGVVTDYSASGMVGDWGW
jgi:ribonucleotide reductase beta subunit family protein with ferritin-like domain